MINLNSTEFESKSIKPFNNGQAGIVNCTISSVDKDSEKNRWIITYTDEGGGQLRDFYTYLDTNNENFEKYLQGQGRTLRHLWKEIVGDDELPVFKTPVEMLDTIMSVIKTRSKSVPFRLVVDYGSGDYHNTNLNRKKFVPFIEKAIKDPTSLFMVKGAYTSPAMPTDLSSLSGGKDASEVAKSWLDR